MSEFRTFFGDGEKAFAFSNRRLIEELEQKTGKGIGALCRDFEQSTYKLLDVLEVIRIGLIGGGSTPLEADRLVNTYAVDQPMAETLTLADGVISAFFFGVPDQENNDASGLAESMIQAIAGLKPGVSLAPNLDPSKAIPASVYENAKRHAALMGDLPEAQTKGQEKAE